MGIDLEASSEKALPQPHILSELVYAPEQPTGREDTILLPLMTARGVIHAVSIGPGSQNMAESFDRDNIPDVISRQEQFLRKNALAPLERAFLGLVPRPGEAKVIDITTDMIAEAAKRPEARPDRETDVRAECLFTKEKGIPLLIKPADCPTAIIEATTLNGEKVVGVAHLGRPQVNERVVESVLKQLRTQYQCSPDKTYFGFVPSIGPQHYFIKEADQINNNLLDYSYWQDYLTRDTVMGESVLRVDVLSKILSILAAAAIPAHNIEAYGHAKNVDTFDLASENPPKALSNRFATSTGQPNRNGRILVAAQL